MIWPFRSPAKSLKTFTTSELLLPTREDANRPSRWVGSSITPTLKKPDGILMEIDPDSTILGLFLRFFRDSVMLLYSPTFTAIYYVISFIWSLAAMVISIGLFFLAHFLRSVAFIWAISKILLGRIFFIVHIYEPLKWAYVYLFNANNIAWYGAWVLPMLFSRWIGLGLWKKPKFSVYNALATALSFLTWQPVLYSIFLYLGYRISTDPVILWELDFFFSQRHLVTFASLVLFKFVKAVVHTFSYIYLGSSAALPEHSTVLPSDVTVIIPSVGEFDAEFVACLQSILVNAPAQILVVTVGQPKFLKAKEVCKPFSSTVQVIAVSQANKRARFIQAANLVKTHITAYADDHIFWPTTFLKSALSAFEDPHVGLVGTVKRVIRDRSGSLSDSFRNYIACIYFERHNFECTASYNIDGGVPVISGLTGLARTEIMHSLKFRRGFLNEYTAFHSVGPIKVDDDNFITRFMVNHGFKTVFHNRPDAILSTTLGTGGSWQKFNSQLQRWARTTWRSNTVSLFNDRTCWKAHPWTTYTMFISSFFNIALIYDPLLYYTLSLTRYATRDNYILLTFALLISKLIKPAPFLWRNKRDLGWIVPGIVFGYGHSLIRLYALLTAHYVD